MTAHSFARQLDLWKSTLDWIQCNVEEYSFQCWFLPIRLHSIRGNTMTLAVDNQFAVQVLKMRYFVLLQNAVSICFEHAYDIEIAMEDKLAPESGHAPEAVPSPMLNPRYTFDSFVVGSSNRFAHAASLAVAQLPAEAYNPLFLYGGVGLGKTHLMHAIGHHVAQQMPGFRVMYLTSENFINQLIDAISQKTNSAMRDRLRNVDVLMIDDIQFIAGKTRTQEEFFHTFNELHANGKQIIMCSDRPPREIPTLEERLRSRFEGGLIADIQKPDYETRIAILQKKAETERIYIHGDILKYIAEHVDSNIRELEGTLTRIVAKATLEHSEITPEFVQTDLSFIIREAESHHIDPNHIMGVVGKYYNISIQDIIAARRNREIALPRQVAMYLTRDLTSLSTTRIGEAFGGRDHTTVMHACSKVSEMIQKTPRMREIIAELKELITHRK